MCRIADVLEGRESAPQARDQGQRRADVAQGFATLSVLTQAQSGGKKDRNLHGQDIAGIEDAPDNGKRQTEQAGGEREKQVLSACPGRRQTNAGDDKHRQWHGYRDLLANLVQISSQTLNLEHQVECANFTSLGAAIVEGCKCGKRQQCDDQCGAHHLPPPMSLFRRHRAHEYGQSREREQEHSG